MRTARCACNKQAAPACGEKSVEKPLERLRVRLVELCASGNTPLVASEMQRLESECFMLGYTTHDPDTRYEVQWVHLRAHHWRWTNGHADSNALTLIATADGEDPPDPGELRQVTRLTERCYAAGAR